MFLSSKYIKYVPDIRQALMLGEKKIKTISIICNVLFIVTIIENVGNTGRKTKFLQTNKSQYKQINYTLNFKYT